MAFSPPQQYTTPDGRTVSFPPEFAANFQGLTPVAPPPGLAEGGGGMPVPPPPAPPEMVHEPVAQLASPPDGAAPAPPKAAPAKPVQPSTPRPTTDAELGKIGQVGALNAATDAIDQQAAAGRNAADVEAAAQTQMADAYAQRNTEIDAEMKQRQAAAEEKLQRTNAATAEANAAMKAYADHRVHREVDHPVLAAIGLALGAIGSAMKGSGDNPALTMLMQQMDKSVQLQMADRDKLKDVAGMKKQAIDQVRQAGDDKIAVYNLAMAGETDKAIRKIEEIKTRTSSDIVRANADVMVAGLQKEKAAFIDQHVTRVMANEAAEKRAKEQQ